jgi:hypothetical protein
MPEFTSEEVAAATKAVVDNGLSFTVDQVAAAIQLAEEKVEQEKEFLEGEGYDFNEDEHPADTEIPDDGDDEDEWNDDEDQECEYGTDTLELYQQFVVDFKNGVLPASAIEVDNLAMLVYKATQDGGDYGDTDQSEHFNELLCAALGFEYGEADLETEE